MEVQAPLSNNTWIPDGSRLTKHGSNLTMLMVLDPSTTRITFTMLDCRGAQIGAPFLGNVVLSSERVSTIFHSNASHSISEFFGFPHEVLRNPSSIQRYLFEPKDCSRLVIIDLESAGIQWEVWGGDPCVVVQGIPIVVFNKVGPIINAGISVGDLSMELRG